MFYHPDNPPFKLYDLVVVKNDVWYECVNGREYLVFRKGEVLKVRGCWFFSRTKGWDVAFFESERNNRHYHFRDNLFQLKSETNEPEAILSKPDKKQLSFFQKIIKKFLP